MCILLVTLQFQIEPSTYNLRTNYRAFKTQYWGAMTSETWARLSSPAEYQSVGSLGCLPLFPYFPGFVGFSTATGPRTHSDFIANTGDRSHADHLTAYRGRYAGYPIVPYSSDIELQTYFGPYPPTCYLAPNDGQKPTIYHGNYILTQDTLNDWAPLASWPGQQLPARYHTAVRPRHPQAFEFGHSLQLFRGFVDCGDSHDLDLEMKKLKEVWRVGVGIKRKRRKDKKEKKEEQSQDETTHILINRASDRLACTEESLGVNSETLAGGLVLEKMCEKMFNLDQDTSAKSSDIPSGFKSSIITDQLDEVIEALEEFETIDLLPSPEVTPVRTKPISKHTSDKEAMMATKVEHPPLIFGPEYRTRESPASRLSTLKENPKLKCKTALTSITKGVTSLRPPKAITRSSKPVTQPAPFNLVGETVSRKLRLKREQRRQSLGDNS